MERFSQLQNVSTPEVNIEIKDKKSVFVGNGCYMDADDELKEFAKYIKLNSPHNSEIEIDKIKFLYTTIAKKDGGRYVMGSLFLRSDAEKMVNNQYDYILFVHYKSWKELNVENKVIQLDKILCGVDVDVENNSTKKCTADSKEYINNMRHYGPETVLNSSEIVDMAITRIAEEEKEEKKIKK